MDTKYEYWCQDEKNWVREWSASPPTQCINNPVHTITDVNSIIEFEPSNRQVLITEQKKEVAGTTDFFIQTVSVETDTNPVVTKDVSWPFDIYIYEINMFPYSAIIEGDEVDTIINPEYTCGTTTSTVNAGDTVISVTDTVLKYVRKPGWYVVTITDGTNSDNVGRVVGIDRTNGTITVETATINSFASGSVIKVDYYIMYGFELFSTTTGIRGGSSKIGGTLIPANTPVRIIYHNNTGIPKKFVTQIEYCW